MTTQVLRMHLFLGRIRPSESHVGETAAGTVVGTAAGTAAVAVAVEAVANPKHWQ